MTQQRLKEVLSYNKHTGVFTWVKSRQGCSKGLIAGTKKKNNYIQIKIDGILYKAHRLAWLYTYGEFPSNVIDHINQVKDDNRIENLRDATIHTNNKNRPKQLNNTSGVVGVRWSKETGKWKAYIQVNGKIEHLGSFDEIEDAKDARHLAKQRHGFHQNHA